MKQKKLKEIKYNKNVYERAKTVELDIVFDLIKKHFNTKAKVKENIDGYEVNVSSLRLKSFLENGINCSCCEAKGKYFAIERDKKSTGGYHLNLYGEDSKGNEVLFTHNHILARSLDGEDVITNTRTSCGPCNWKKGRLEFFLKNTQDEEEIKLIKEEMKQYFPEENIVLESRSKKTI